MFLQELVPRQRWWLCAKVSSSMISTRKVKLLESRRKRRRPGVWLAAKSFASSSSRHARISTAISANSASLSVQYSSWCSLSWSSWVSSEKAQSSSSDYQRRPLENMMLYLSTWKAQTSKVLQTLIPVISWTTRKPWVKPIHSIT